MDCQYPSSPKCSPYRTRQPELSPGRDYTIIKSPILNELHWLPVEKRITFKLFSLAYKCNQGVAPQYLLDIVKSYHPAELKFLGGGGGIMPPPPPKISTIDGPINLKIGTGTE